MCVALTIRSFSRAAASQDEFGLSRIWRRHRRKRVHHDTISRLTCIRMWGKARRRQTRQSAKGGVCLCFQHPWMARRSGARPAIRLHSHLAVIQLNTLEAG